MGAVFRGDLGDYGYFPVIKKTLRDGGARYGCGIEAG